MAPGVAEAGPQTNRRKSRLFRHRLDVASADHDEIGHFPRYFSAYGDFSTYGTFAHHDDIDAVTANQSG